jgi:hypothetical protein
MPPVVKIVSGPCDIGRVFSLLALARAILKERFARGEIEKEECDEKRRILNEGEDAA